jgi:alpha-glucosidase
MKRTIRDLRSCRLAGGEGGWNILTAGGEGGAIVVKTFGTDIVAVEYDFLGGAVPEDLREASRFMMGGPVFATPPLRPDVEPLSDGAVGEVPGADAAAVLSEERDEYILTLGGGAGPATTVRLEKAHGIVSVYRGSLLVHGGRVGDQDTVIPAYPVRCVSEGAEATSSAYFNFPLAADDAFYGLGDKSGESDRRGRRFKMFNRDSLGYDAARSDPLYKSVPFFMKRNRESGALCGLFFPAAWIEDVDFGMESPYYFKVHVRGGPFSYFVLLGEGYRDVLRAYCRVTGFPALPPLFSFGFFGSSMNYVEADDAAERILGYFASVEKHGIPCEGMYVSSGYLKSPEGKRYAFLWNKRKFPDYGAFLRSLSARGYNLCMNIKPGILTSHPWYAELAAKGYLIADGEERPYVEFFWGGEASFIDFANPAARGWWISQLREQYLDHGCTGIWNDNNELELEDEELAAFRTRALYPVKMAEAAYEAFKERESEVRPWIYSRSGYAGLQRYARTWTGDNVSDWQTLRYNQYQGLSLALSGMPFYGHDLGGFFGEVPSEDLLVRSCQSAVFQPRFVIHSWRKDDRPTEPWTYPSALDAIRGHIREHYRFMPYTYNCAVEAASTGAPIERPLFLEFPDDPQLDDRDTNSLYGPSILKVLVVDEGAEDVRVRFPAAASWYDPREGRLVRGGSAEVVRVPREGVRWFARTGSVIPTSPGLEKLSTAYFPRVEFLVFPEAAGGTVEYRYYEDDGRTEPGLGRFARWLVAVSYDAASGAGQVRITEEKRGDDPSADRVFSFALPRTFRFVGEGKAEATVGPLREAGGGRWDFQGNYRTS